MFILSLQRVYDVRRPGNSLSNNGHHSVVIQKVHEGYMAALQQQSTGLAVGQALWSVNGKETVGHAYADAIQMIRDEPRPVTLVLRPEPHRHVSKAMPASSVPPVASVAAMHTSDSLSQFSNFSGVAVLANPSSNTPMDSNPQKKARLPS
eukprot:SAG31_NODE_1512_length_8055_cov_3.286199_6_plen_150_part_00